MSPFPTLWIASIRPRIDFEFGVGFGFARFVDRMCGIESVQDTLAQVAVDFVAEICGLRASQECNNAGARVEMRSVS
jgi:hypothetical protein